MSTEVLNKMIKYMMDKPYREVFELMDEVRVEVARLNKLAVDEPTKEEVVDGD